MGLKGMSHPSPPRGGAKTAEGAVVDYHLDPEQMRCARLNWAHGVEPEQHTRVYYVYTHAQTTAAADAGPSNSMETFDTWTAEKYLSG
jgi:hypothetical protein